MIKNAIKAVTLYTMTGLTIRRPTISKNRHLLVFFNYTPIFSFQRQTDADVRPLPYDRRSHDANAPSHITSLFFDLSAVSPTLLTIFTTLEGTSATLEGTSTRLLTTFGDTRRTKRKHVSDETGARAIRSGST